jgi:drug/metabolite transporter (DMT)-like permease
MRLRFAPAALLGVAALWGSTFFLMKDAIQRQDVNSFLFTRFAVSVLVLIAIRPQVLKLLSKDLLVKGIVAGTFLAAGYILQTLGLDRTTAAVTGFITGMYVTVTPLMAFFFQSHKLSWKTWSYIAIATFGLALLSLNGFSLGFGELLVLGSAIAFAAQIIVLSAWSAGRDAYALTVVQLATCALISGIAVTIGGYQAPPDNGVWAVVLFTAVFATALAFFVQTWSQAHMAPTKVAVILVMEIVFAAFFAVVFGSEHLTTRVAIGGTLIVCAMYLIVKEEA